MQEESTTIAVANDRRLRLRLVLLGLAVSLIIVLVAFTLVIVATVSSVSPEALEEIGVYYETEEGIPIWAEGLAPLWAKNRMRRVWMISSVGRGFTDEDMEVVRLFSSTSTLYLTGSRLSEKGYKAISSMSSLIDVLDVPPSAGDEAVQWLATLPILEVLDLRGTRVTNESVAAISRHQSLRKINLRDTQIDDTALLYLGRMRNLKELSIMNTAVSDKAVDEFRRVHPHVAVDY